MCTTNCDCCSMLTWDYTTPATRHYINPTRDSRKAGGILIYNGRVLIVQSRGAKWGFPKGGIERGENMLQCAKREVHEETSFNIVFTDDDMKIKCKDTTFYVKYLQTKPPDIDDVYLKAPGNDCTGIGWIRFTCLKKLLKPKDDLVDKLNNMSLNNEVMQFNLGIRRFVKKYIH